MVRCLLAVLLLVASIGASLATPSRIIILRHGEKADEWKLCGVGQQRAKALAANFLGRDSKNSLFASGEQPAAFYAITLHTVELAAPAAESWNMPITLFSVVPDSGKKNEVSTNSLNRRTEEAVAALMADPNLNGKIVVMVWEHKHVANAKLEAVFPGQKITLRQLLKLDELKDVPTTWPSDNFDYFWIVDFAIGSSTPSSFSMAKQSFAPPFDKLPSNDWDKPNRLKSASGCEMKGR
jgi:broad specificity phosphatase PhoE